MIFMIVRMDIMKKRYRLETTKWGDDTPNHVYITSGTDLLGYINIFTGKEEMFKAPMRTWSVRGRTFRDLRDSEVKDYLK